MVEELAYTTLVIVYVKIINFFYFLIRITIFLFTDIGDSVDLKIYHEKFGFGSKTLFSGLMIYIGVMVLNLILTVKVYRNYNKGVKEVMIAQES